MTHSMRGVVAVPWSDEERAMLRRMHDNGLSQGQIAAAMGRSKNSIHRQLGNLGLIRSDRNSVVVHTGPGHASHRAPKVTLPPLPSLSMRGDGECGEDDWLHPDKFWP